MPSAGVGSVDAEGISQSEPTQNHSSPRGRGVGQPGRTPSAALVARHPPSLLHGCHSSPGDRDIDKQRLSVVITCPQRMESVSPAGTLPVAASKLPAWRSVCTCDHRQMACPSLVHQALLPSARFLVPLGLSSHVPPAAPFQ